MSFEVFSRFVREQAASALPRNSYFDIGPVCVYVRCHAFHFLGKHGIRRTLDIANVNVDPDSQNKGYFRAFLGRTEHLAGELNLFVYVENIHNPILTNMLARRGYEFSDCGMHAWKLHERVKGVLNEKQMR